MGHVFLDAEVVDGEAEVEGGGHGDGGQIRSAVEAGADVVECSEVGGLFEVGDAAAVDDGHADVVNPLIGDKLLRVPEGVEDFSGGEGCGGVLADKAEGRLEFGGDRVFKPEEVEGFELFAEASGFDRGEAVMNVVEEMDVRADCVADGGEEFGSEVEVTLGRPERLGGKAALSGLVGLTGFGDAVAGGNAGDAGLGADGEVAEVAMLLDRVDRFGDVGSVSVGVDEDAFAGLATEEVVERGVEGLGFDVPERHVDGGDGGHGDGAAAPVSATVKILPDVFDAGWVAADEAGEYVLGEVRGDGEFAAIKGGVAEAVDAFICGDFKGDEVAIWGADDEARVGDLHAETFPAI